MSLAYKKIDGKLVAENWFKKKFLKKAYGQLMVGSNPFKSVSKQILKSDYEPNSLIYYPYSQGQMKAAALVLMRMGISSFRMIHSHYLIEVFVNNSEEDTALSSMYSPFFLIMHGFIPTPNRRLLDLIQEFCTYKQMEGTPFIVFTTKKPEPALRSFFELQALPFVEIRSAEDVDKAIF